MKPIVLTAVCKTWQTSISGLLLLLLYGCSTPLPNSAVPNAANVWVGSNQGTGRWSMNPGDADIGITRVDSIYGNFPPLSYLDTAVDLSTPLHLVPGRHSIKLLMGAVFAEDMGPAAVSETGQTTASGVIDGLFLSNHSYRITAIWRQDHNASYGFGTFEVTLWDVTLSDDSPVAVQSWSFHT